MEELQESVVIDWSDCALVEVNPRKVGGAPILKETRVPADAIVINYVGASPIEEIFALSQSTTRELLDYAARDAPHLFSNLGHLLQEGISNRKE